MSEPHDRRSPYLVLGIDYGAPIEEARQAFARRARQIRRSDSHFYGTEDLTWALHAIETLDDPTASVEYFRVPANRAGVIAAAEGDLFLPAPIRLPRRTEPLSAEQLDAITERVTREMVDRLLASATAVPSDDPYCVD